MSILFVLGDSLESEDVIFKVAIFVCAIDEVILTHKRVCPADAHNSVDVVVKLEWRDPLSFPRSISLQSVNENELLFIHAHSDVNIAIAQAESVLDLDSSED